MKSRGTPTNSSPHLPQLEKAHVQQWRPGAAKKKSFKKDFLDTTPKAQSIKEKKKWNLKLKTFLLFEKH